MSFFFSSSTKVEPVVEPVVPKEEPVVEDKPVGEADKAENNENDIPKPELNVSVDEDDAKLQSAFERALKDESPNGKPKASLASPTSKVGLNYDENPTNLYQSIEAKEWDDVLDICEKKPNEASIWIFRNEKTSNKLRWRLLPIHAAIIFRAPDNVVKALVKAYPEGAASKDDQEMTPLHLAFRHDVSDAVLYELLKADPTVVHAKDRKGRVPLDLHRSITGQTPKKGTTSKKSGIAKLVSIAVASENRKTTLRLRQELKEKLSQYDHAQNAKYRSTVEQYEDRIFKLRSEMAAKIESMDQSLNLSKTEAENKIKELEQEMSTARLASESLITRFDLKCKEEEELKAKLTAAECKLKELEWGTGDTIKEKAELLEKIENLTKELEEVKTSRQETVQKLFKVTQEKDALELSLTNCQATVKETEEAVMALEQENTKLQSTAKEQRTFLDSAQGKMRVMEESISAKAEQIGYLQEQNENLQNQRDDVATKLSNAIEDLKAKKERLQFLESAEAETQEVTSQLLSLQAQLKEKEDKLNELHATEWGQKIGDLTSQVEKLQSENDSIAQEIDETRVSLKQHERELADAKTASNNLIKQYQAKCTSEIALKKKLTQLERDLNTSSPSLKSENVSLRQTIELLEKTNEELGDKIDTMEKELEDKTTTAKEIEEEYRLKARDLKEQEVLQTAELTRGREKIAILERIIAKLQEKIYDVEAKNRELQATGADSDSYSKEKIAVLTEEVATKNALNSELSQRLRQLEMKNADLSRQLEKTKLEKEQFSASLKERQERTMGSLSARQRMSDALENQLEASQEYNHELQTKIKTLEARNGTLAMKMKTMAPTRRETEYEMRDPSNYTMSGADTTHRMPSMKMESADDESSVSSFAMRQRMKQNVERQVKLAHDKAYTDRKTLLENARKQRKDIESSFASATAAINMLRDAGSMNP